VSEPPELSSCGHGHVLAMHERPNHFRKPFSIFGLSLNHSWGYIRRCPTGEARITPGFRLPARHVIHTVGPIYDDDETSAPLLASAYRWVGGALCGGGHWV
jgi:hypothetical protein